MSTFNPAYRVELDAAAGAARVAGQIVKDYYDRAAATIYEKGDGSPVTDADLEADRAIRAELGLRFPDDSILSEEGFDDGHRLGHRRCWIVDPVDGTEQFIQRTGEFDILVAFVEDGRPVAVAGYQPTTDTLITATKGGGAWVQHGGDASQKLEFEPAGPDLRLATSKWFGAPENQRLMNDLAARLGVEITPPAVTGFTPRMFCPPRSVDAMIGVRPGEDQTMASEWDFAVADLVFHEAGGIVTDLAGRQFQYNKPVPRNVGGLIAAVDPQTYARVLTAIEAVRHEGTA